MSVEDIEKAWDEAEEAAANSEEPDTGADSEDLEDEEEDDAVDEDSEGSEVEEDEAEEFEGEDNDSAEGEEPDDDESGEGEKSSGDGGRDGDDSEGDTGRAPVSWNPEAREKWAKIPASARAEIARREQEIADAMGRTAQARQFSEAWQTMLAPYEPLMQAQGANAYQGVKRLLEIGAGLSLGTPAQKAEIVANVVQQYGVDLETLDGVLAGTVSSINDPNTRLMAELDKRLAPIEQRLSGAGQPQVDQNAVAFEIQQFAKDPKNEFFNDVRSKMSTLFEIAGKEGRDITLQQAYDEACQLTPSVKKVLDQRTKADTARERKARAEKKRQAAAANRRRSTPTPSGGTEAPPGQALTATIRDAWDQVEGGGRRRV